MTTIAIIGLGAMGRAITGRLLAQGYGVVAWNRTESVASGLVRAGAAGAATPADAAHHADLVITTVADDTALLAVTEGPSGVAAGIGTGVLAQMATVSLPALHRLRDALPAGAGLLDAPVLGSVSEAEAGTLRVFAGGDESILATAMAPLQALGTVIHTGGLGTGAAAKLVANSTLFGVLGVLGEALALARRLGLSQEQALRVLAETPVGPPAERRRAALTTGDYPMRFALSMALKDADLIQEAAHRHQADLRVGRAARSWLAEAAAASGGGGDSDYSTVLRHLLRQHPPATGPAGNDGDRDAEGPVRT